MVKKDKVVAFQFHPEKSGKNGLLLLNNVLKVL
jgi:imidazoleglycerol phosphate synthase glutamine amidotransferase subunit HisH